MLDKLFSALPGPVDWAAAPKAARMAVALSRDGDARSGPLGGESRLSPSLQAAYLRVFRSQANKALDEYFGVAERSDLLRRVRAGTPELTPLFEVAPPRALGFPPRLFTEVQYQGRRSGLSDFSGGNCAKALDMP